MRCLAAACLAVFAFAAPAAAKPNIVVLMTDDQTLASLSSMQQTNTLLASQGTVFDQATSTFPLCCPSRATHLTGQYSHNHQVVHNAGEFGGSRRLAHANTLPVWLQNAGYRTMHVGRYLNGHQYSDGIPPGWDEWYGSPHAFAFNYYRWRVNENGALVQYPVAAHPDEYLTDFHGRKASELIQEAAPSDKPFYLQLWFVGPHRGAPRDADDPRGIGTPSPAPRHRDMFAGVAMPRPPSFDEADVSDKPQLIADRPRLSPELQAGIEENWRQELESLQAVDEAVARIVATLEQAGELANTLIVYTSDNGYMHGEHRAKAEKVLLYEESSHVPMIVRGPGVPAGFHDPRPVANIDVVPTLLEAAEAEPGRVMDGRSLWPLIRDHTLWWGRDVLLENGNGANNVTPYRAIRTGRFVYAQHLLTGEFELYDLETDPYQLRSVDGTERYAAVQRDLASRLRLLRNCAGRGCQKHPGVRLGLRSGGRRVGPRGCAPGDLRVRFAGRERAKVVSATAFLGERRVARVAGLSDRIRRPRMRPGRPYRLRVRTELRDGRIFTLDHRLRACG